MKETTIAVVDDDPTYAEAIKDFLESHKFKVWRAVDVAQFSVFLKDNVPDLVILDMQMPAGGGPAAAKFLRNRPETKEIPVIFISSMPAAKQEEWFPGMAKTRFMQKPPDLNLLVENIKAMLAPQGA